jgi:protein gp37
MGDKTGIGWTGLTWNILAGCSRESEECINCYAEDEALRLIRMSEAQGRVSKYAGLLRLVNGDPRWNGEVRFIAGELLTLPIRKRKPRLIFVNSMSDLFHPTVHFEHIAAIFGVMAVAWWHTFQTLTKRPARMREWFTWARSQPGGPLLACARAAETIVGFDAWHKLCRSTIPTVSDKRLADPAMRDAWHNAGRWPLRNVWLGTSIGLAKYAAPRATDLLACEAAVHWVSCEPLLDDVAPALTPFLSPVVEYEETDDGCGKTERVPMLRRPAVRWIVAGGESQPGARPCDPAWLRSLRDACIDNTAAYFLKQLGGHPDSRAHGKAILDGATHTEYPT